MAAIALNTRLLEEEDARAAIAAAEAETGLPADDPVRFGSATILDAVLALAASRRYSGSRRWAERLFTVRVELPIVVLEHGSPEKGTKQVKRVTAALACVCALLSASTAQADVGFGANDDTGKYSLDGGAVFFPQMAAANLKQNVMTVRWKPSDPTNIPDQAALDVAVPMADAAGIEVAFAVYPYPPSELEVGGDQPSGLRRLARHPGARLPAGDDVHRRQRAEPEHVLAAAGRRARAGSSPPPSSGASSRPATTP